MILIYVTKFEVMMNRAITHIFQSLKDLLIRNRRVAVIIAHLVNAAVANYIAFMIRLETVFIHAYMDMFLQYLPLLLIIRLAFHIQSGLYKDLWRYSSVNDMVNIIKSTTMGSITFFVAVKYVFGNSSYPQSIYILDWLLLIIISGGSRLMIRVFREYLHSEHPKKKILIVGAGDAGENILRDINNNPGSSYKVIGFIDEDPYKKGYMIRGIPILGPISLIPYIIENSNPDEILVTTTLTDNEGNIKKIYELSKPYNIPIKKLPNLYEILDGNMSKAKKLGQCLIEKNVVSEEKIQQALELQKKEGGRLGSKLVKLKCISEERLISFLSKEFGLAHMRPISLEDLLQRDPVSTDIEVVKDFIENKSVIVTGAGGSIGSELCRQIIKYAPSELILLDRYENGLFKTEFELKNEYSRKNGKSGSVIVPLIGDIVDCSMLEYIFLKYSPQIVFHAAAHKHVPMMELNPLEAIRNNVLGTRNLLDTASRYKVESFVMISTDKAVNPTSIMGASKRVAEFLTIAKNNYSGTNFTTVRFGNVLGSNGSVVPTFKEQLKNGGPVTVTHPEMKRFFMLTSEAVQLVLLATASGKGGEIFVLDMGDPVKIGELAENIIRLSGFIPNEEIKIVYTGLRPGEKMYEELFDSSEKVLSTFHEKLRIAVPEPVLSDRLFETIQGLENCVRDYSTEKAVSLIKEIVPGFRYEQPLKTEQPDILI